MRASGILLHITSLPTPHGLGTLGREAREFVDFLRRSGQKYWQILPLGPTGYGDSPYQTDSAFAGNPYLIDLDALAAEGLLTGAEVSAPFWGASAETADFGALYANRLPLLEKAYRRGWARDRAAVAAFEAENRDWLPDYALYRALKKHFGMRPWTEWADADVRLRRSAEALERYRALLRDDIQCIVYIQYLFFRQWEALRSYAGAQGIAILGDVPIYVPLDSADVWAEREYFQLDREGRPVDVAGVPPDRFTADGQLWGNPLYDWARMERDGFRWWLRRLEAARKLYDMVRIDHFRGLESYWAVPGGDATARNGVWRPGPGLAFVRAVQAAFPGMPVIAEDLGYMTPEVKKLRDESGYPGMKILQFAFGGGSDYLPHAYEPHCACYTGTHDNAPLRQWLEEAEPEELAFAGEYLGLGERPVQCGDVIRAGMRSVAELFVAQMQDWLELGGDARMNLPGTLGNWRWRMAPGMLTDALAEKIARMTELYGR